MENKDLMVAIPLFRYEGLLDIETRVNVAVRRTVDDEYCKIEDVLRILGTELALQRANELKEADKRRNEEWEAKHKEHTNAD